MTDNGYLILFCFKCLKMKKKKSVFKPTYVLSENRVNNK